MPVGAQNAGALDPHLPRFVCLTKLAVDITARVLRPDGAQFPNLFAGGGAARGLSGPSDWGYLSGSGLLMATNLGRLAGEAAAELVSEKVTA